jgi:hypothetical protein
MGRGERRRDANYCGWGVRVVVLVGFMLASASALHADTVTATWNANTESDIAGYLLAYGTVSGQHPNGIPVGNVTTWQVSLAPGQRYYFVIQAYNSSGLYSLPSAEAFVDLAVVNQATLTYPANGAVNADLTRPIQWTTIAGAQGYYLNVGSAPGTSDLVDSGVLQQTSYQPSTLPIGRTVYARVSTMVGGVWRYSESTFSVGTTISLTPTITYPANGAVNADLTLPIRWAPVIGAQAYWLNVGSTLGAADLVSSGSITQAFYQASTLPAGRTVFARIYAMVGGVWRYTESTFSARNTIPLMATLTYPANGAVNADLTRPIQWTTIAGAQGYYLNVGSAPGTSDLADSGTLQQTSYEPSALPLGRTVYARVSTMVGGVWRYTESTFSVGTTISLTPTLSYPANGAVNADLTLPIRWSPVIGAQAYWLNVGSTLGAADLVSSGSISQTFYQASTLPSGRTAFARIYAMVGGVWRYTESTFSVR